MGAYSSARRPGLENTLAGYGAQNASAFLGPFLLSADWCGLKFKPPKCATLHIHCRQTRQLLPTQFNIQGGSPVALKDQLSIIEIQCHKQ